MYFVVVMLFGGVLGRNHERHERHEKEVVMVTQGIKGPAIGKKVIGLRRPYRPHPVPSGKIVLLAKAVSRLLDHHSSRFTTA